jgi:FkbM family methyltransferase
MPALLQDAKRAFERITDCRIYRNSLPHGADCFYDIARKLGRDGFKVVFDVGANVGQSALTYLHEFPRAEIFSFEPVAATYQQLVAATSQFPRVHPYQLGMGREAGEVLIHVSPESHTNSIVTSRPEDHLETITLETITGFAEKHRLETIDFLKVDTEGFDLEVLAGAKPLLQQQRVHFVLSECEPFARTREFVSFQALGEFLTDFGYSLFGVYEQHPEWDGGNILRYWNALFICEKLTAPGATMP